MRDLQLDTAHHPEQIAPTAFVAPNATVLGDVAVGDEASIWFGAVLRGDTAPIRIGPRTNLQDNCVLHADAGQPCTLGAGVTVGHGAIVHAATLEDNVLIGMGAIILNRARVGRDSVVGAGALIAEDTVIPPGSLAVGVPARVVRQLTAEEIERIGRSAEHYVAINRQYMK
jgi:carbonic anhydrase/acetyltransferase-like protein (isoleucine patch superfamily)